MSELKVGFCRLDVTPPLGIRLMGNNNIRLAENILDPLEISVMALACGETKVLLISMDALYRFGRCAEAGARLGSGSALLPDQRSLGLCGYDAKLHRSLLRNQGFPTESRLR